MVTCLSRLELPRLMLIARFIASKISEGSVDPPFSKRVFAFERSNNVPLR
jgi:hypothetical protein